MALELASLAWLCQFLPCFASLHTSSMCLTSSLLAHLISSALVSLLSSSIMNLTHLFVAQACQGVTGSLTVFSRRLSLFCSSTQWTVTERMALAEATPRSHAMTGVALLARKVGNPRGPQCTIAGGVLPDHEALCTGGVLLSLSLLIARPVTSMVQVSLPHRVLLMLRSTHTIPIQVMTKARLSLSTLRSGSGTTC